MKEQRKILMRLSLIVSAAIEAQLADFNSLEDRKIRNA